MKKTITHLTLIALTGFSSAAIITINNITGSGEDLVFADSLGSPLGSGFVAVYSFSIGSIPSDATSLKANGVTGQLGIATFNSDNNDNSADPGSFTRDFTLTNDAVRDLYVVIGEGSDVNSSTFLALLDTGLQLDGDDSGSPTGDSLSFGATGNGNEILIGTSSTGTVDWGETVGSAYDTNILSLSDTAAIPEPSSVLLSSLALFALTSRRRK